VPFPFNSERWLVSNLHSARNLHQRTAVMFHGWSPGDICHPDAVTISTGE
jgi:hypothetical protein